MPKNSKDLIKEACDELAQFLIAKNEAYGDSALHPIRKFSKADAEEAILVRLDDKLNRIIQGSEYPGDDTLRDFAGYFILLECARKLKKYDNME